MLFNSYVFILAFLPATLAAYRLLLAWRQPRLALFWLFLASCAFYGWWNPLYLPLLGGSILANFALGRMLSRQHRENAPRGGLLALGIAGNLGLLGYFKYTDFLIGNMNALFGADWMLLHVILPLGISFFTFQKIAYLVDCSRGEAVDYDLLDFALFVMFFPQLIAGPIVHHREIVPQFADRGRDRLWRDDLAVGSTIFLIGLAKKVLLADGIAGHASPTFAAAQAGADPGLLAAWGAALGYTLQLYFDFSGYTDMAIGGARLFGIRLPLNFHSPYQAGSIIEFWRRWHMTLSRFLRDYVYIPLGGNRRGPVRRQLNLFLTMLIGGLWHGAAWTFVLWGALHGLYLVLNHGWRALGLRLPAAAAWALTFLAVTVAWVPFRAESFAAASRMLGGMAGLHGIGLLPGGAIQLGWLLLLGGIALAMPNTQQIMAAARPALGVPTDRPWLALAWRPSAAWALGLGAIGVLTLARMSRVSEFLYYQF